MNKPNQQTSLEHQQPLPGWAMILAYDGSDFKGFQALPGLRTVQSELEKVLSQLLGRPISTLCGGRTDAGVHAYGQVVGFEADLPMPPERFSKLLSDRLPKDIVLKALIEVPAGFHARFLARARHYRYRLRPAEEGLDPFCHRYLWQYPYALDLERLRRAWKQCLGHHDFKPFARAQSSRRTTRIQVWVAELRLQADEIWLELVADSFLYSMVRNLVGTALDVSRGRLPVDQIQQVLAEQQGLIGPTAPAQGLYLCRVLYPPEYSILPDYPQALPAASEARIPAAALLNPGRWWN